MCQRDHHSSKGKADNSKDTGSGTSKSSSGGGGSSSTALMERPRADTRADGKPVEEDDDVERARFERDDNLDRAGFEGGPPALPEPAAIDAEYEVVEDDDRREREPDEIEELDVPPAADLIAKFTAAEDAATAPTPPPAATPAPPPPAVEPEPAPPPSPSTPPAHGLKQRLGQMLGGRKKEEPKADTPAAPDGKQQPQPASQQQTHQPAPTPPPAPRPAPAPAQSFRSPSAPIEKRKIEDVLKAACAEGKDFEAFGTRQAGQQYYIRAISIALNRGDPGVLEGDKKASKTFELRGLIPKHLTNLMPEFIRSAAPVSHKHNKGKKRK